MFLSHSVTSAWIFIETFNFRVGMGGGAGVGLEYLIESQMDIKQYVALEEARSLFRRGE